MFKRGKKKIDGDRQQGIERNRSEGIFNKETENDRLRYIDYTLFS